jgi:hypothetical protein
MAAFDNLFGDLSAGATLTDVDLRHVMRRAQRLAGRGVQPPGVAGIRDRAAGQAELAREIGQAIEANDMALAAAHIRDGAAAYGHSSMVAGVEEQARQAHEAAVTEHYLAARDEEWLDDEPP